MDPARRLQSTSVRARDLTRGGTRTASAIALGAFTVHQLRLLVAAPRGSDPVLSVAGLGAHLVPLLVGLLLTGLIARLVGSRIGAQAGAADRRVRATTYAIGILAVFCTQQMLEGVLIAGHVGGLAAIFSAGGWAALPLAIVIGVIAALVDRGIAEIEARLAGPVSPSRPRAVSSGQDARGPAFLRLPAPLAFGLARRPPPACV